jgi:hypothetical protein
VGWTPAHDSDPWYFLYKTREETIDVVYDKFARVLPQPEEEEEGLKNESS